MGAVKVCAVPSARVPIVGGRVLIGRCNPVINGDFQNLTGLIRHPIFNGQPAIGWYEGVPYGWSGIRSIFNVRELGNMLLANLHTLTQEPPNSVFFQQTVGRSCCGVISLRFYVDNPFPNPAYTAYSMTHQILEGDSVVATGVVSGNRSAPREVQLDARVRPGSQITIRFRKDAGNHAMGITNVKMAGVLRF